jgi:hypothetical protein
LGAEHGTSGGQATADQAYGQCVRAAQGCATDNQALSVDRELALLTVLDSGPVDNATGKVAPTHRDRLVWLITFHNMPAVSSGPPPLAPLPVAVGQPAGGSRSHREICEAMEVVDATTGEGGTGFDVCHAITSVTPPARWDGRAPR